jgi:hypothetical protein
MRIDFMPLVHARQYIHTGEVVSPKRPNLILSTDIPDIETCVLVRDGLDVEADSRNGVDFACGAGRELEGVENGFGEGVSFGSHSTRSIDSCQKACAWRSHAPFQLMGLQKDVLVFPAASRPSINRRISLLPKILARERESAAPMVGVLCCGVCDYGLGGSPGVCWMRWAQTCVCCRSFWQEAGVQC